MLHRDPTSPPLSAGRFGGKRGSLGNESIEEFVCPAEQEVGEQGERWEEGEMGMERQREGGEGIK